MGTAYRVPFLDLSGLHAELEEELLQVFARALKLPDLLVGRKLNSLKLSSLSSAIPNIPWVSAAVPTLCGLP